MLRWVAVGALFIASMASTAPIPAAFFVLVRISDPTVYKVGFLCLWYYLPAQGNSNTIEQLVHLDVAD